MEARSADSLLARLKAETAHLHRRLESAVPLMRPTLDRAAYAAYLAKLLAYQRPLEERLAGHPWAGWGLDFSERRKAGLLEVDLLALGETAERLASLQECSALPAAASLAEAWGCLYVLEGSTLGGQIILRHLEPRLQLSRSAGLAFLAGYGEHTGPLWKAFTAALTRFDAQVHARDEVVRGANQTFSTLMDWLQRSDTA